MIWFLDFRDRNVGGPVLPARLIHPAGSDPEATLDLLAIQPHLVIVTHGFNVNRESGVRQLQSLASSLSPLASSPSPLAVVAVTWPGDSWAGPAGYPLEGNDADDTALELIRFIEWAVPSGTKLSFVSHSLGARVVFETIKGLPAGAYPIGQICVMAAAIDDFSVSEGFAYRHEVESAERVAVLASERDNVLRWAYPTGDLIQSFLYFWKDLPGSALGFHGPRATTHAAVPANVEHVQIPTHFGVDHGDYLYGENPSALELRAQAFVQATLSGEKPLRY